MKPELKKILLLCAAVAVVVAGAVVAVLRFVPATGGFVGNGSTLEIAQYPDTIGSVTTPATLTLNQYASTSSVKTSGGMANMVIAGTYTPKSYGSQLYISMERSIDKGVSYFPYGTLTSQTDSILVNTSGTSTSKGSPFAVPGNNLNKAASGTPIHFSFDLSVAADFVRFTAKEVSTTTPQAGSLNLQTYFTSN